LGMFFGAEFAVLFPSSCVRADVSCAGRQPNRRRGGGRSRRWSASESKRADSEPCKMKFRDVFCLWSFRVVFAVSPLPSTCSCFFCSWFFVLFCFTLSFTELQQSFCRGHVSSHLPHPAQRAADRRAPRPLDLRLRPPQRVEERRAARAARRSCG
jgi:hypothetical protein